MEERRRRPDRLDSIADFYREATGEPSDPMLDGLRNWDYNEYQPLQLSDPELHQLICDQLGFAVDIFLGGGTGTVKLGRGGRFIELTWNGDDEDLVDLVMESAWLIADT